MNTPYFNHTIICTARSLRTGQTFRVWKALLSCFRRRSVRGHRCTATRRVLLSPLRAQPESDQHRLGNLCETPFQRTLSTHRIRL